MATVAAPPARTPLHHWHAAHGARLVDRDGWQVPAVYTDVERETAAARTGLGVADVSAFAKAGLFGPGVTEVVSHLAGEGHAVRPCTAAPLIAGGPGVACRLTADSLLLLASTTDPAPLAAGLRDLRHERPLLQQDETSARAAFWLVGPRIEDLLHRLTAVDVRAAPVGSCAETALAGVAALLVASPELEMPSLRVCVSWDLAEFVWECLLDAGLGLGAVPLGLDTIQALHPTR
jgi:glycine cleavage system aminomethyltransferase T